MSVIFSFYFSWQIFEVGGHPLFVKIGYFNGFFWKMPVTYVNNGLMKIKSLYIHIFFLDYILPCLFLDIPSKTWDGWSRQGSGLDCFLFSDNLEIDVCFWGKNNHIMVWILASFVLVDLYGRKGCGRIVEGVEVRYNHGQDGILPGSNWYTTYGHRDLETELAQ